MAAFEEGHEKKGGRQKGVRNKNTEMKDKLRDFVIDNFEDFCTSYGKLTAKEKCRIYMKALEFVVPKVSAIKFEESKDANSALELLKIAAKYKDEK